MTQKGKDAALKIPWEDVSQACKEQHSEAFSEGTTRQCTSSALCVYTAASFLLQQVQVTEDFSLY